MQKRANISLKDYDEFYKIKIEIIPEPNKSGKFINTPFVEHSYYHIYFNNNFNEEIERNHILSEEKVDKINVIIDYRAKRLKRLFDGCKCIKSISFKQFYRKDIFDMEDMFDGCASLKEIDLTNYKTNYEANMKGMFKGCSSLKSIKFNDAFNFDNIKVFSMFDGCPDELKNKIRNQFKNIDENAFGVY